jgi:hypothetical protein
MVKASYTVWPTGRSCLTIPEPSTQCPTTGKQSIRLCPEPDDKNFPGVEIFSVNRIDPFAGLVDFLAPQGIRVSTSGQSDQEEIEAWVVTDWSYSILDSSFSASRISGDLLLKTQWTLAYSFLTSLNENNPPVLLR